MSLKNELLKAIEKSGKKFKIGDKVYVKYHSADDLKYKIEKVNNISYDLKIDMSEEEIESYRKIISESVYLFEVYFECWEERLKKNTPHSKEDIIFAKYVIDHLYIHNVEEDSLTSR